MTKYLDMALSYKGSVFAFILMYVIVENTTKKDVLFRLTVIAFTASESTELVQHLMGWGSNFVLFSQALGVFTVWAFAGVIKCLVISDCRKHLSSFIANIRASK